MRQYLTLLKKVIKQGTNKKNRTITNALSIFGYQMRFNLNQGFPIVTTKKCHIKSIIHELLWFLQGDTNIDYLKKNNVSIWDDWADENGNLGPIYGKQWRDWTTSNGKKIDQIKNIVEQLNTNPDSRRIIVSCWNVGELEKMSLAPCHILFQLYVSKSKLSCQVYQRSCDVFLGLPFNIASYALLIHMLAQQSNLIPGDFIWTGGDIHLYENHIEKAKMQIARKPKVLPTLLIKKSNSIFDYRIQNFKIINYHPHAAIKAEVAI